MSGSSVAYLISAKGFAAVNDNLQRDDDPILRILGRLEATVQNVQKGLDEMRAEVQSDILEIKTTAKEDRHDTSISRRRLHEKFEGLQRDVQATTSGLNILGKLVDKQTKDVETLMTEVADLKPVVATVNEEVKTLKPIVIATSETIKVWAWRVGKVTAAVVFFAGALGWVTQNYGPVIWRFVTSILNNLPKG